MKRLLTISAILGILVSGTVAAGSLAGCTSNSAGLGLHRGDAQAPGPDAAPGKGGAAEGGSDAAAAGRGGSGGVSGSGGVTAEGGTTQTGGTTGTGGTTRTGGTTGTGGSTPAGGTTGAGGVTGGTTGAGGAGATGGSTRSGGATGSGGAPQTGGSTGTGGATRTGGATGTGGSPQTGGTTGTGGATRTGGATGAGGTAGAGGATRTGGATASGGTTGAGGSTRTGGTTASGGTTGTGGTGGSTGKSCGGFVGASCAAGEFCEIPAGRCNVADASGTCVVKPQICSDVYLPVCGCDGKTYGNDCGRQAAGVSKKADGACAVGDAGATACGLVTTQAECDSRSDCHSVFVDPGLCNCVPAGCCAYFSRCADGGHANCRVPATLACAIATPFCETPFVLSYTAVCYEGCVRPSECAGADAATTSPAQK